MWVLQKQEVSQDVLQAFQALAQQGAVKKWGAALAELPDRRSVMLGAWQRQRQRHCCSARF